MILRYKLPVILAKMNSRLFSWVEHSVTMVITSKNSISSLNILSLISVSPNYSLLFPYKSENDYVIITHRMPSLTAVTVCMWIKTNATGNRGTLLSYAVSGQDNELLLLRPRDFVFSLRSVWRYENTLSLRNRNNKLHMMCRARLVLFKS